jgi:hypothetical protein
MNMQTSVEKKECEIHHTQFWRTGHDANRKRDTVSINARDDANIHFKGGPRVQSSLLHFLGQIEYWTKK